MFPQVTLSGNPYERGRYYGQEAAGMIRHSVSCYALVFAYSCGLDWQTAQEQARRFLPALANYTPDLLAEMEGIAAGSGCNLAEIVALNARTELLGYHYTPPRHPNYTQAQQRNLSYGVPQPVVPTECTALLAQPAATGREQTLLAQTWDWLAMQNEGCVVLRVAAYENQPALLTMTEAGMVGKIGLNSAGLAVGLTLLRSETDGEQSGLPIHVFLRYALQQPSVQAVRELAQNVRFAATSSIPLADSSGDVACLEVSPAGVEELQPEAGLLVHTNHCLSPVTQQNERPIPETSTTHQRYQQAETLAQHHHGRLDPAAMMAILCDRTHAPNSICRSPDLTLHLAEQAQTVAGLVLDVNERVMYLAPGQPDQTDFTPLTI